MHIVLAVIGIATAVYFLVIRARNAAEMTSELLDVADDVRAAARRFGFRRNKEMHPVEAIEDPNTAAATLANAYIELHGLPSEETRAALSLALQSKLAVSKSEADDLMVLARWLMNECQGAQPAISRGARKLYKLVGNDIGPMMEILEAVSSDPLSDQQKDALEDIRNAFKLR